MDFKRAIQKMARWETKRMKKTILALALTAAAVPFTFAAQNAGSTAKTATAKKSHKKAVKKPAVKSSVNASSASSVKK
jgi:hypothetical protein